MQREPVLEAVRRVPGIHSAGAVNTLPLTHTGSIATLDIEGRPRPTTGSGSPTTCRPRIEAAQPTVNEEFLFPFPSSTDSLFEGSRIHSAPFRTNL